MCRQWPEKFDASFDRGLTARPVVLAKTYEPGGVIAPAVNDTPGRTFLFLDRNIVLTILS
jgi:hypothetical protein